MAKSVPPKKKNVSSEWRRNRQRLQWALPAVLAIIPISQVSNYAVARGIAPSWFYGSPIFYCFAVMVAIFASYRGESSLFAKTSYAVGGRSARPEAEHEHKIQSGLAMILALWGVFIPLLRAVKLADPELMQMLHYVQVLMDAGFVFLVLISVIDLCSGIFFDAASDIDEDEIAVRRAHAVKIGYITAVLSLIALYLIALFMPVWTPRLLSPLTALSLVFPMMTIAQPVESDPGEGHPHATKIGFATAVLGMGGLYLFNLLQPDWTAHLLLPLIGLTLVFPFMALLYKPKPAKRRR